MPSSLSTSAFLQNEGINADLAFGAGQGGQITGYTDVSMDISELQTLGITQIRTFITNSGATLPNGAPAAGYDSASSAPLASYEQLAAAGIKFDFIIANGPMTAAQVAGYVEMAAQINSAYPGSVIGIEGVNESNNNPAITFADASGNVTSGDAAALAMQQAIYADVQASAALSGVTVVDYTTDSTFGGSLDPNPSTTSGIANVANFHEYADQGYPGNAGAQIPYIAEAPNVVDQPVAGAGETWVTEWGFPLYPGNSAGVTEQVAGDYELDTLMDYAKSGTKNFLYGLNEDTNYFGEYYSNNALTTEGQDVANLNAIVSATAGSTTPTINATADLSALTDGNMMQVGSDLVVWAEPELVNQTTGASAYPLPSPTDVTVNLGGTYDVSEYDPTVGTGAITTLTDVTSVTVGVAASPIVMALTPVSGGSGGSSGPDTLTLVVDNTSGADQSFTVLVGDDNPNNYSFYNSSQQNFTVGAGMQTVTITGTFDAMPQPPQLVIYGYDSGALALESITNDGLTNPASASGSQTLTGSSLYIADFDRASDAPITLGTGPDEATVVLNGADNLTQFDIVIENAGGTYEYDAGILQTDAGPGQSQTVDLFGTFTSTAVVAVRDYQGATGEAFTGGSSTEDPNSAVIVQSISFDGTTINPNATVTASDFGQSFTITASPSAIIGQPGTFITTPSGGATTVDLEGGTEQVQAQGTDTINVGTGTDTVYANTDADPVTVNGGPAGSSGTYVLGTGGTVNEGAGTDTTTSYGGGMTFIGGSGSETVNLSAGGNAITAGTGALSVFANSTGGNTFSFLDQASNATLFNLTATDVVDVSKIVGSMSALLADTTYSSAGASIALPSGSGGTAQIMLSGVQDVTTIHFKF